MQITSTDATTITNNNKKQQQKLGEKSSFVLNSKSSIRNRKKVKKFYLKY